MWIVWRHSGCDYLIRDHSRSVPVIRHYSSRVLARWSCLPDVHCFILTNAGHGLRTRNAHPTQTPARGGSKKRGKRGAATDGPESNSHWYLWSSVSYASSRVEFSALVNSRVCGFQFFWIFGQANKKHHPIYVMVHRHPDSGNRVVLFNKIL